MNHIQIRFNTKANGSPLIWRVIVDNKEFLADNIEINGKCYGEESIVNNEKKYNIACDGYVTWKDNKAIINSV